MSHQSIVVPSFGESVTEATVGKWFKKIGDTVALDEPLVELESDKATVEINAPCAGILKEIKVFQGEDIRVGEELGSIALEQKPTSKAKQDNSLAQTISVPPRESASKKNIQEVKVPSFGESVTEATVGTLFKKVGEFVALDEPLLELESDKATAEINAPCAGILKEFVVKKGDDVQVGSVIARIEVGESVSPSVSSVQSPERKAKEDVVAKSVPSVENVSQKNFGPAVDLLISQNNLDVSKLQGSGKDGRLTKIDVLNYIAGGSGKGSNTVPSVLEEGTSVLREERVKMSRLRRVIGERLKSAQNTAALLTTFNEVDMTNLMQLRHQYKDVFEKKHNARLGFMSFFMKAAVVALKEIPAINAQVLDDEILYKNYYDISIAVGSPQGLVVPVVRDCENKSLSQIETTIADFGKRAREGKLLPKEMSGGTFTISNGGVYGSLMSTPIINPPQSAILGMHNIVKRPMVMESDTIQVRSMMYLALSYDHRIIDGKEAVTFLVRIKQLIEDPSRFVLDL